MTQEHQHIDAQTINDLEFDVIRLMLHDYCTCDSARLEMVELKPYTMRSNMEDSLQQVKALKTIYDEGLTFPALDFHELKNELASLEVEGSVLPTESFLNILQASTLVNELIHFFAQHKDRFHKLAAVLNQVYPTDEIIHPINAVFDEKGLVRDTASAELAEIRGKISSVKRQISRNFNKVMRDMRAKGYLDDIGETFLNERRLLAVVATHKRKISGITIGSSKTGSLCYIEPQVNVPLNYELEMLIDDERNEIRRILRTLTAEISIHVALIAAYQELLVQLDVIRAKARLALALNADLPGLSDEMKIELIDAYHPLLYLTNEKEGIRTFSQSIMMDKFSRMLVISGPNAGGKSITLKTVGLIQLMFQSGLLVPVNPNSKLSFFQHILTDIGDNQSIENQLSTYSYRLKRMKLFLELSNRKSLLLLDEFGTGSDPELGGALAEVFFEKLYTKKSFGVITTHYTNIKMKATQLKNAINGCMLFDRESLEPMYQLSIGQPGSSFTFEVAEINGIDPEIIESAKSKLDGRKIKLDQTIASLQKEKSKHQRINEGLSKATMDAREAEKDFEKKKLKFEEKLGTQQLLIERNNKYLNKGKKMDAFIREYATRGKNNALLAEVKKYLAMEKTKLEAIQKENQIKLKATKAKTSKKRNVEDIKIGSLVKLHQGKEAGTVLSIEKKEALVAFGIFRTRVEVSKLVLIK